ncbi:MAG: response regulator [Dehalococcoidia bacterium]|nr:response regulator [Dehalococcoidia bacterium]
MYKENILLVDNNQSTMSSIKNILSSDGYALIKTESCTEALSIIQKKNIDVLILSLSIHEKDCLDVLRRARFLSPEIGVIVMTQDDSPELLIKAFQAGAQAILEKPVNKKNLKEVVEEVLQRSRLAKDNMRLKTLLPLFELNKSLVSELDADKIFNRIVNLVCIETRADRVSLMLMDEFSQQLIIKAAIGLSAELIGKGEEISDDSIAWSVVETGRAILLNGEAKQIKLTGNPEVVSSLCVPLLLKKKVIGVINCSKITSRTPFTEGDLELLYILAGQAAIAIENATLFDSVRMQQRNLERFLKKSLTAQEDERRRISSELHDGLAQWLVSASYGMQLCEAYLTSKRHDDTLNEIKRTNNILNQSVKELRRIILDLHPIALAELGLIEALRRQVEGFNRENGFRCDFRIVGSMNNLSLIQEVSIYRIILEAMNNIRKHARASHVDLVLKFDLEYASVEIADDGQGFDLSAALNNKVAKSSIGLITMKERAEMLGGRMEVDTAPGNGTKINVTLPVSRPSDTTLVNIMTAENEQ